MIEFFRLPRFALSLGDASHSESNLGKNGVKIYRRRDEEQKKEDRYFDGIKNKGNAPPGIEECGRPPIFLPHENHDGVQPSCASYSRPRFAFEGRT
ncbi:hypothetical protein MRX96_002231 [Rhipicephalus microplus]